MRLHAVYDPVLRPVAPHDKRISVFCETARHHAHMDKPRNLLGTLEAYGLGIALIVHFDACSKFHVWRKTRNPGVGIYAPDDFSGLAVQHLDLDALPDDIWSHPDGQLRRAVQSAPHTALRRSRQAVDNTLQSRPCTFEIEGHHFTRTASISVGFLGCMPPMNALRTASTRYSPCP